ncbi:hypothetical protein BSKO_05259 [Bryopsis sp. KO-2023]|nr:hypothetical protein BSKO_05259 [Bryopsis sp. KO-2023]
MRDASNPQTSKQEGLAQEKASFQFQLTPRDVRGGPQHAGALGTANPYDNWLFQSLPIVAVDGTHIAGGSKGGMTTVDGSLLMEDEAQRQKTEKQREKNRERARRWRARKKAAKLLDRQVEKVQAELPRAALLKLGLPSMNPPNPSPSSAVALCVAGVPAIERDGLGVAGPLELERLERVREKNRERARRYRARQKKKKLDAEDGEPSPDDVDHKSSCEVPIPPDATEAAETVSKFPTPSSAGRQHNLTLAVRRCEEALHVDERQRKLEDQRAKNRERVRRWRARQKAKRAEASSGGQQEAMASSTTNQVGQGLLLPMGIIQHHASYPQSSGLNELANLADMELVRMQQAVVETATAAGPEEPSVMQSDMREAEIRAVVDRCAGSTATHTLGQVAQVAQLLGSGGGQDGLHTAIVPSTSTTTTTGTTESNAFPLPLQLQLEAPPKAHIPMSERRRMARHHHLELVERVRQSQDCMGRTVEAASGQLPSVIDQNSNDMVPQTVLVHGGGVGLVNAPHGVEGADRKRQKVSRNQMLDDLVGAMCEGGGKPVESSPSLSCLPPPIQSKEGEGLPPFCNSTEGRGGNDRSVGGGEVRRDLGAEDISAGKSIGSGVSGSFVQPQSGPPLVLTPMSGGQMDVK